MIGSAGADVGVGEINLLASRLAQRYAALVGDDTSDFDPYGFGRLDADKNALADGGLIGIRTIGQNFVNDGIGAAGLVVVVGEGAAVEQGSVHGFEIAGKHDYRVDGLKFAGIGERFFGAPTNRAEATSERKWICGGYALNAGDGAQAIFELANGDRAFLLRLEKSIGLNLEGE